ncbi:hypothetical protein TRVL_07351 [Trypanosoma vivax]|nr:hypothetical protein TRVL_07351 [Trypanosoma vivax]
MAEQSEVVYEEVSQEAGNAGVDEPSVEPNVEGSTHSRNDGAREFAPDRGASVCEYVPCSLYVATVPLRFTEIPQKFLLSSGGSAEVSPGGSQRRHLKDPEKPYRFSVPLHRPLPTRWEPVDEPQRLKNVESVFFPLFSGAGCVDDNMQEAIRAFLTPPEGNRRREIERRKENEAKLLRCNSSTAQPPIEPIRMPDLGKKVPPNFVPHCAAVPTASFASHMEEIRQRIQEMREKHHALSQKERVSKGKGRTGEALAH